MSEDRAPTSASVETGKVAVLLAGHWSFFEMRLVDIEEEIANGLMRRSAAEFDDGVPSYEATRADAVDIFTTVYGRKGPDAAKHKKAR